MKHFYFFYFFTTFPLGVVSLSITALIYFKTKVDKGMTTIYSIIGDSLAWLYVVELLMMIGLSFRTFTRQ